MQFVYEKECGSEVLIIEGEGYAHLFKSRRHRAGELLAFRNMMDDMLYHYEVREIGKKDAGLRLVKSELLPVKAEQRLHLLWCVIDPKSVEKVLPSLCEMGVAAISFLFCERSQKNFRPTLDRLERIAINSAQQCGRSSLMSFEEFGSLPLMMQKYDDFAVLDFGGECFGENSFERVLIGCEGGFTDMERKLLSDKKKIGFDTPLVLKSESAAVAVASKLLL